MPKLTVLSVATAGYPFIIAAAFITAVLALLGLTTLVLISLLMTLAICGFIRDPDRIIPDQRGALVSPADGKVIIAEHSSIFNLHFLRLWFQTNRIAGFNYYVLKKRGTEQHA